MLHCSLIERSEGCHLLRPLAPRAVSIHGRSGGGECFGAFGQGFKACLRITQEHPVLFMSSFQDLLFRFSWRGLQMSEIGVYRRFEAGRSLLKRINPGLPGLDRPIGRIENFPLV
jgi:hypothetical protein